MKQISALETLYTSETSKSTLYRGANGLLIWDVFMDLGLDREILIGHLSDIHYNYCNLQDFDEDDPVLMSTLEHRRWLAGGASVPIARRCRLSGRCRPNYHQR